jgi:hypothetical protein
MTMSIGGLRVLNVHIAKDAHGAFAARPGTLTDDFISSQTGGIDLTFVGLFQRMITINWLRVFQRWNFLASHTAGQGFRRYE